MTGHPRWLPSSESCRSEVLLQNSVQLGPCLREQDRKHSPLVSPLWGSRSSAVTCQVQWNVKMRGPLFKIIKDFKMVTVEHETGMVLHRAYL